MVSPTMATTPSIDEIVTPIPEKNFNGSLLVNGQEYVVDDIINNMYLKLVGIADGFLFHKSLFSNTGKRSPSSFVCMEYCSLHPTFRVGEVYKGVYSKDMKTIQFEYNQCVPSRFFSRVRNWDECKLSLEAIHASNIDKALKEIAR